MKAWTVALLLCLLSVCRAAPPVCDQIFTEKPPDQDLSGRWYVHAISYDSCLLSNFVHQLLKPSFALDFSLNAATKGYDVKITAKMLSFCMNDTDESLLPGKTDETYYLLPNCADCVVVKEVDLFPMIRYFSIYSRKTTLDVADLKQFEMMATCLKFPRPFLLNSDYDFINCKDIDDNEPSKEEVTIMGKRIQRFISELFKCIVQNIWKWIQSFF